MRRTLRQDDGAAAQEHLLAGGAISYCDDVFDEDDLIREWPDETKQLVDINDQAELELLHARYNAKFLRLSAFIHIRM